MQLLDFTPYVALAISLITLGTLFKNILSSGEKALDERTRKNESKLIELDRRTQSLEGEMKHLPDKDSVHKLQLDLTEMKSQLVAMIKSSEATERATRRVEEFLMNNK